MTISRVITVWFGVIAVLMGVGCSPGEDDGPRPAGERVAGKADNSNGEWQASLLRTTSILTDEEEVRAKLRKGVSPEGFTVEDQYLYSVGVRSEAVANRCGKDWEQPCDISLEGFLGFRAWLFDRTVVGPWVPPVANSGGSVSVNAALEGCQELNGKVCHAMKYRDLMEAQVERLSQLPLAIHKKELDVVEDDFMGMQIFGSTLTLSGLLPAALRSTVAERFANLAKQHPELISLVQCSPPVAGEQCYLVPKVNFLGSKWIGAAHFAVIGQGLIYVKRIRTSDQSFVAWEPPSIPAIGGVEFTSKQVTKCTLQPVFDPATNKTVIAYPAAPNGQTFAFYYSNDPLNPGNIKLLPGNPCLGFEVTYVPTDFSLTLFDADIEVWGTNVKTGATPPFCANVVDNPYTP